MKSLAWVNKDERLEKASAKEKMHGKEFQE